MAGNIIAIPPELGDPQVITVANPAAGANWTYTVPAGRNMRIMSLITRVATSMVGGNRRLLINFSDPGGTLLAIAKVPPTQAANLTFDYTGFWHAPYYSTPENGMQAFIIPKIIMGPGCVVTSNLITIDAGDQLSNIRLVAQIWKSI